MKIEIVLQSKEPITKQKDKLLELALKIDEEILYHNGHNKTDSLIIKPIQVSYIPSIPSCKGNEIFYNTVIEIDKFDAFYESVPNYPYDERNHVLMSYLFKHAVGGTIKLLVPSSKSIEPRMLEIRGNFDTGLHTVEDPDKLKVREFSRKGA